MEKRNIKIIGICSLILILFFLAGIFFILLPLFLIITLLAILFFRPFNEKFIIGFGIFSLIIAIIIEFVGLYILFTGNSGEGGVGIFWLLACVIAGFIGFILAKIFIKEIFIPQIGKIKGGKEK